MLVNTARKLRSQAVFSELCRETALKHPQDIMDKFSHLTGRFKASLTFGSVLFTLGCLLPSQKAHAGNGSIDTSASNLDLNVLFAFSETEENLGGLTNLESWRNVFDDASARLWNATNGQLKIGKVRVYRRAFSQKDAADIWILPGNGTAYSNGVAVLGLPGYHATLFGSRHRANKAAFRGGFSLVHELSHYVFGLYDQYQGGFVPASRKNAWTIANVSPIQKLPFLAPFNIMAGGGGIGNTATEYDSVADVNTGQTIGKNWWMTENWIMNKESSWETLGKFKWNGVNVFPNVPLSGPSDTTMPPGNTSVVWEVIPDVSRLAIVIDRSGSMGAENRMALAKLGAGFMVGLTVDRHTVTSFVNGVTETNEYPPDRLTVIDFDGTVTTILPIAEVDSAGVVRRQAKDEIAKLDARGSTAIGRGVQQAVDVFNADSIGATGAQENIIVLSDGMDNSSGLTTMDVASTNALNRGAKIYSIALGSGADGTGLLAMADRTGGKFFQASDGLGLLDIYSRIYGELRGGGIMESLASLLFENTKSDTLIPVDEFSEEVTFAMVSPSPGFAVQLTSPSGKAFLQSSAPDGVLFQRDDNSTVFRVSKPMKGNWKLSVVAPKTKTGTNYRYNLMANATSPVVSVTPSVSSKTVSYPNRVLITCPVTAGSPVAGVGVTAEITGPDGSVGSMTLFDSGSAVDGDKQAGDGVYSGYYGAFPKNGVYSFLVKAVNVNGVSATGGPENSPNPSVPVSVPAFTRVAYTTVSVSNVPSNLTTDWMRVDGLLVSRKKVTDSTAGMQIRCTINTAKGWSAKLGLTPMTLTLDSAQITIGSNNVRKTSDPNVFLITDTAQGISGSIISEIGGTNRSQLLIACTKLSAGLFDFDAATTVRFQGGGVDQSTTLSNQTSVPQGLSITYLAANNFATTPALHVDGVNLSISRAQNNSDSVRCMVTYQGTAKYNPVTDDLKLTVGQYEMLVQKGTLKVANNKATGVIKAGVSTISVSIDLNRRIISMNGSRLNLGSLVSQTDRIRLEWGASTFDQSCGITMQSAQRSGNIVLNY